MKRCTRCGNERPVGEFYRDKSKKDGLTKWCRSCSTIYRRESAKGLHISTGEQNFDIKEYQRKYYREQRLPKLRAAGMKPRIAKAKIVRAPKALPVVSPNTASAVEHLIKGFAWDRWQILFWARVSINENGCWEWQGAISKGGYGLVRYNGVRAYTHRVAYEIANGPLGDFWACHHCDNPRCVNPLHLYAGTPKDNAHDRERRGRGRRK